LRLALGDLCLGPDRRRLGGASAGSRLAGTNRRITGAAVVQLSTVAFQLEAEHSSASWPQARRAGRSWRSYRPAAAPPSLWACAAASQQPRVAAPRLESTMNAVNNQHWTSCRQGLACVPAGGCSS